MVRLTRSHHHSRPHEKSNGHGEKICILGLALCRLKFIARYSPHKTTAMMGERPPPHSSWTAAIQSGRPRRAAQTNLISGLRGTFCGSAAGRGRLRGRVAAALLSRAAANYSVYKVGYWIYTPSISRNECFWRLRVVIHMHRI